MSEPTSSDPKNEPVPPSEVPMVALFGESILVDAKGTKKDTLELLKDKEVVCLYFSAQWCPPCRAFSPLLIEFYNKHAAKEKLEIIYVSSDRSIPQFEEYYGKMPWLAIPSDEAGAKVKNFLAQNLKISGIPSMVVLDVKTGKFISNNGREQVSSAGVEKGKELIDQWKATEPVTFVEGVGAAGGFSIGSFITAILSNPAYIFAIMYFAKWIWAKWEDKKEEPSLE